MRGTNAGPDTVLSFFPKRESDPIEGPLYQQADLRDSIFNEVNVDLTRQCENALDLAALAALHAVSVLLDRSSHPDLEVFRIFEEAISVLVGVALTRSDGTRLLTHLPPADGEAHIVAQGVPHRGLPRQGL